MDTSQHGERLQFLKIDSATSAALAAFRPTVQQNVQTILQKFYDHVTQRPHLREILGGEAGVARARAAQAAHWLGIFEGKFDDAYVQRIRRIGKAHERVGLEPRWYVGGYALALNELIALAVQQYRRKPDQLTACLQAMVKGVMLDMDYAISVYIEEGKATFAKQLNALADGCEATLKAGVEEMSGAAFEARDTATAMAQSAEETLRKATTVATAAEDASTNIQTVASAAEELSSSVAEISRQVTDSTRIAGQAVDEVERTNTSVKGLAEAAQKIGAVVKLINDIAGQTNLLALNATIEAARAGEAGKGFAVVASEVKSLANQTAKATEDIAAQINAIQTATRQAVETIGAIGGTINQVSEIATTIAAAVEEQGAATREIARNIQQASTGTQQVSVTIASVGDSATQTGRAAATVRARSTSIADRSASLRREVDDFLKRIRAS